MMYFMHKYARAKDVLRSINCMQLRVHSHQPPPRGRDGMVPSAAVWHYLQQPSALQSIFSGEEICSWWPWHLTFDLDIQTRSNEWPNVFPVNLVQICSAVPEIFDSQTQKNKPVGFYSPIAPQVRMPPVRNARQTSCPIPCCERAQIPNFWMRSIPNLWTRPMSCHVVKSVTRSLCGRSGPLWSRPN